MPHNICIDRSAKQLRGLVPAALRASAPGHAGRYELTFNRFQEA
jgi:hypothetical protein